MKILKCTWNTAKSSQRYPEDVHQHLDEGNVTRRGDRSVRHHSWSTTRRHHSTISFFIIVLDYALGRAMNGKEEDLGFTITLRKSRRHPKEDLADLDFADDITLLYDGIKEAQELLNRVETQYKNVGLGLNAKPIPWRTIYRTHHHCILEIEQKLNGKQISNILGHGFGLTAPRTALQSGKLKPGKPYKG